MSDSQIWLLRELGVDELDAWRIDATTRFISQREKSGIYGVDEARDGALAMFDRLWSSSISGGSSHVFEIGFGAQVFGDCWMYVEGKDRLGAVILVELNVSMNDGIDELRRILAQQASALGAEVFQVSCNRGDEVVERLVTGEMFELSSTRMLRQLEGTQRLEPSTKTVKLIEMTDEEFAVFRDHEIESYADDLARSGSVPRENALAASREQTNQLLPLGRSTPLHFLFRIHHGDELVGWLWLYERIINNVSSGFVYDIDLDESARGKGLGRAAMVATEFFYRDRGAASIMLNVFGFNDVARRLYHSIGYVAVESFYSCELRATN